jgi:hypothetical protein
MPVTYKEYPGYPAEPYLVQNAFVGATLSIFMSCDRVMSDIWENRLHALVWDAATGKTKDLLLVDPGTCGVVDATPEVIEAYRQANYDQIHAAYLRKAEEDSNVAQPGSVVVVKRGRKDQGKVGKVVFIKQMPYQAGYRSYYLPKLCVALDGTKTQVQGKYGKTFDRYTNVIWVWSKNCDVANPKIDLEAVERRAKQEADLAVEHLSSNQYRTNYYA